MKKALYIFLLPLYTLLCAQYSFAQRSNPESKVRVMFMYGFTKNFEWPGQNKSKEFKIGVLGNNHKDIQDELIGLSKVRTVGPLTIKVLVFKSVEEITPTEMLYENGDDDFDQTKVFDRIKGKGTLLIAENLDDFDNSMINFIKEDGDSKMQFSLNQKTIAEANINMSSSIDKMAITDSRDWKNVFSRFKSILAKNTNEKIEINRKDLENVLKVKELQDKEKRIKALEEQTKEKEHEAKVKQQKIIIYSVISGLLLVLIFAAFILRTLQVTRRQKQIIEIQKNEAEKQKQVIEEKQKEIIDSIHYAKRIQTALLASEKYISNNFNRLMK